MFAHSSSPSSSPTHHPIPSSAGFFHPSGSFGNAVGTALVTAVKVTTCLGNKIYTVCHLGSRAAHDLYGMDGFEKLSKAILADGKCLLLAPAVKAFMGEGLRSAMQTVDRQKDLYYATMFVNSLNDYIFEDKEGWLSFGKIPQYKKGTDWSKVLQTFGNLCEVRKFLQKYDVVSFPRLADFAQKTAPLQFLTWGGRTLIDHNWADKEFYLLFSSGIDLKRCLYDQYMDSKDIMDFKNVCKIIGSIGKIALITLGRDYGVRHWFVWIDVATQGTSLISWLYEQHRSREQALPSTPVNRT